MLRSAAGWLALLASLVVAGPAHAAPPGGAPGLRLPPRLGWGSGDHRVRVSLESRARTEIWDAHSHTTDAWYALRSRLALRYSWRDTLVLFGELQDARIWSLSPDASGAGALYRRSAQGRARSRTHGDRLRALWVEWRPRPDLALRVGRQDLALGGEVRYPERDWRRLEERRVSERLVGSAGWNHAGRAFDGIALHWDSRRQHTHLFAVRPTTGVFDVEGAYQHQSDLTLAGGSWTLKRDHFLPFAELSLFGLFYDDERPPRDGGRAGEIEIATLGFSALAVLPLANGRLDLLAWGAFQLGDFGAPAGPRGRTLDHRAWAVALEMGHRWRRLRGEPWLRLGTQVASGDGDPGDGDHDTFFALLPTGHRYHGIADRVAFQNLVDLFAQLLWEPWPGLTLEAAVHWLHLFRDADALYGGSGAYDREGFGFEAEPSRGHGGVGTELDLAARFRVNEHLAVSAGYAHLWGRGVLNALPDRDVRFAYLELDFRY